MVFYDHVKTRQYSGIMCHRVPQVCFRGAHANLIGERNP